MKRFDWTWQSYSMRGKFNTKIQRFVLKSREHVDHSLSSSEKVKTWINFFTRLHAGVQWGSSVQPEKDFEDTQENRGSAGKRCGQVRKGLLQDVCQRQLMVSR